MDFGSCTECTGVPVSREGVTIALHQCWLHAGGHLRQLCQLVRVEVTDPCTMRHHCQQVPISGSETKFIQIFGSYPHWHLPSSGTEFILLLLPTPLLDTRASHHSMQMPISSTDFCPNLHELKIRKYMFSASSASPICFTIVSQGTSWKANELNMAMHEAWHLFGEKLHPDVGYTEHRWHISRKNVKRSIGCGGTCGSAIKVSI